MATSSQQSGYLRPTTSPVYNDPLDDILQAAIVGITGIPGSLVRPRWQPEPPQQPSFDTNWCAFGIVRSVVDAFAYEGHDPAGEGTSSVDRDELLYVLHSFYGPSSHAICEQFRDGFEIGQNRAELLASGVALVEVGEATVLPALLKEKWVKRVDVTVTYRRRTSRVYQVRTIQSADAVLDNERYLTPINVPNA
jgi:hypothetical protein